MRQRQLGILSKGVIIIAIPVVFQFIFLGFMFDMQRQAAEADHWALHSRAVIAQAELTLRLLVQAHSAVRGYVLTHNEIFRKDIDALAQQWKQESQNLRTLVQDNPQQIAKVDALVKAGEAEDEWTLMMENLVETKQYELGYVHVQDLSGKKLLDVAAGELNSFLREEQQLNETRVAQAEHARLRLRWVLGCGAVASLLIGGASIVLFARGISRRLRTLAENAQRLAVGETLVAPVAGNDEVAMLDRVLHRTSDQLREAAQVEETYKAELEKRAEELAQVNRELEQKTAENETFVYSVSHDLRSPLVNLQGFTKELAHSCEDLRQVLEREAGKIDPGARAQLSELIGRDMHESLHFIQTAVARSGNIIDALLRLSRAGRLEFQLKKVDVSRIVRQVVDALKVTIQERGAEIIVHDLPGCWSDEIAIERIFGNLVGNAVNYLAKDRRGVIEIGAMKPQAESNGSSEKNQIIYYVKDNGLGIPAAYLPKIFIAFQRLHGDVAKGEGIGLAVVRRMVERLSGRVWVESAEGVGSTFYVAMPAGPVKTVTGTTVANGSAEIANGRTS